MGTKVELPIFDGEASESDSEENIHISFCDSNATLNVVDKVQCLEITGEDAESDSEEKDSQSSCSTTTTLTKTKEHTEEKMKNTRSQSLLHQKLKESNTTFYNDLEDVIKDFVRDNEKSLTDLDHQISKSQSILQKASPSLKNLQSNSVGLKNKLDTLLTSNFLSNVKIIE